MKAALELLNKAKQKLDIEKQFWLKQGNFDIADKINEEILDINMALSVLVNYKASPKPLVVIGNSPIGLAMKQEIMNNLKGVGSAAHIITNSDDLDQSIIHCHLPDDVHSETIEMLNELAESVKKMDIEELCPAQLIDETPPTPSAKKKQKKMYRKPSKY